MVTAQVVFGHSVDRPREVIELAAVPRPGEKIRMREPGGGPYLVIVDEVLWAPHEDHDVEVYLKQEGPRRWRR